MPFIKQVIWYKNSPRNLRSKKERFDDIFVKGREKGTKESWTVGTTFYEIPKQWYLRHAKVDYISKLTTGKCVENIQNKSPGCSQPHQQDPDVKIVKVFAARMLGFHNLGMGSNGLYSYVDCRNKTFVKT